MSDAQNQFNETTAESSVPPVPAVDRDARRKAQIDRLISTIKESADKLAADQTSRGDLKILSRALRELRYAFKVFSPYRRNRKVTVFGSARTPSDDAGYEQAMTFGRVMAQHDWLVVTGAASGIMEAGHRGAGRTHSMGLNIMLPFEQASNPVIAGDSKLVHMKYFFTRKLMFVKECDAVVCFPGGFGTLDEALEVLTLLQTGKRDMVPVVLVHPPGDSYWSAFHDFVGRELLNNGMISPEDLNLYLVTDDIEQAVAEVTGFYRVYHSMRYVRERLVFRLKTPLSDEFLNQINVSFADIVSHGVMEQTAALPEEEDEPDLADMRRLAFRFDRRSLGRLRLLIDSINAGEIKHGR